MPKTITCYVIQEAVWNYNDEWYYREDGSDTEYFGPLEEPLEKPIQVFRNREKAEAVARALEIKARANWDSPFMFNEGLTNMTSLSEDEFWAKVEALGVARPRLRAGQRYWFGFDWWASSKFKPDVAHAIWDLFDKIRFYDVVPTELPLEA